MTVFEQVKDTSEDIFEHAKEYIEAQWKLGVLNASYKAADGITSAATALIFIVIGMIVLLFMSFSLAFFIGQHFNSFALGFLYVGILYVVVAILLWLLKDKYIKVPLINSFLKKFSSGDENTKH